MQQEKNSDNYQADNNSVSHLRFQRCITRSLYCLMNQQQVSIHKADDNFGNEWNQCVNKVMPYFLQHIQWKRLKQFVTV